MRAKGQRTRLDWIRLQSSKSRSLLDGCRGRGGGVWRSYKQLRPPPPSQTSRAIRLAIRRACLPPTPTAAAARPSSSTAAPHRPPLRPFPALVCLYALSPRLSVNLYALSPHLARNRPLHLGRNRRWRDGCCGAVVAGAAAAPECPPGPRRRFSYMPVRATQPPEVRPPPAHGARCRRRSRCGFVSF